MLIATDKNKFAAVKRKYENYGGTNIVVLELVTRPELGQGSRIHVIGVYYQPSNKAEIHSQVTDIVNDLRINGITQNILIGGDLNYKLNQVNSKMQAMNFHTCKPTVENFVTRV